jgi:hypothetical protein
VRTFLENQIPQEVYFKRLIPLNPSKKKDVHAKRASLEPWRGWSLGTKIEDERRWLSE